MEYRIYQDLWGFLNRSGRRTVSCTHSIFLYQPPLILFTLNYPNNNCAAQFATTADGPIIDPQTLFPSTQPTLRQLTSCNPTSTVHQSLKGLANLFTCLKPIHHVVVLQEYRIRMELRFGVLILECNLRMGIFRLGCFILVDKIRFITSVLYSF